MVKVRDGGTMEYELAFQHVILQHKAMCGQGPQTLKNRKEESTPLPLPRVWGVCVGGASTDSVSPNSLFLGPSRLSWSLGPS